MERKASASAEQDQRAFWQAGVAGEFFQRGEGTARAGGDDAVGPVGRFLYVVIPGLAKREPGIH